MLKGQDMVVLAALFDDAQGEESYAALGARAHLSVSEAHASVKRLRESVLIDAGRHLFKRNVLEFLVHGMRYAFPFRLAGGMAKGIATSYAAPVSEGNFAFSGACPVWNSERGQDYGQAFEPLYHTVPDAASEDRGLYDRLAIMDMLRGGRLRERAFAEKKLQEMIG